MVSVNISQPSLTVVLYGPQEITDFKHIMEMIRVYPQATKTTTDLAASILNSLLALSSGG